MLRIHIEEKCESATIRLEGRLAGPWVEELERCWRNALARLKNRTVVIELDTVTFVDAEGQSLLAEMHRAGAILVGRGVLSQYLAEQIQQHQSGWKGT
jgi:ABC-type transporter Mla MlaB component